MTDTIVLINHGRLLAEGNIYEIRRLIDTHPLQVSIRCDNVNVLTARLLEFEDVLSVQFDRERSQLTVETNRPDDFHHRLPALALEHGVRIHSLWSPDENLEAVFEYLVR
jgi:ABC-2 type transport system ATP-binding protein